MTSKANLPKRVARARSAARFIGVVGSGRNITYCVPGSNGRSYRVKVRRDSILSFQCWVETTQEKCKGNSNGADTICIHSLAVAEFLAHSAGSKVSWCATEADAQNLSNLGGRVFRAISHQNGGVIWGLVQ